MIIISDKKKIPDNPWDRYRVKDQRWRLIFRMGQVLLLAGGVLSIFSRFLWDENEYISDMGMFLIMLGLVPLIAGSRSENEDEYGKILRKGMMVFCILGVIALPVMYIISMVWQ